MPLDESSEDMFVYFEPLYEVIHDMPRPPDSFFKKKTGMSVSGDGGVRGFSSYYGVCFRTTGFFLIRM